MIPITGGWQTWSNVNAAVTSASGVHDLYAVFKGTSGIGNLNWFQFLPVNQAPTLTGINNQSSLAGRTLLLTNSASDSSAPQQSLTFSLASAPPGVAIGGNNGVLTWRPTIAQSPGTQTVAVVVSDNGAPVMSATQSFTVSVLRPTNALLVPMISNGQFALWMNGQEGPDYQVQASTDLVSWSSLVTVTSPALPYVWGNSDISLIPSRFYRVVLGP